MDLALRYFIRQMVVARVILQENTVVSTNHKVVFPTRIDLEVNPGDYEGFIEPRENWLACGTCTYQYLLRYIHQ